MNSKQLAESIIERYDETPIPSHALIEEIISSMHRLIADLEVTEVESEGAYLMGYQEGYERAVSEIDYETGGDGEYVASSDPDRHCPGPEEMKERIVDRFEYQNRVIKEEQIARNSLKHQIETAVENILSKMSFDEAINIAEYKLADKIMEDIFIQQYDAITRHRCGE